MRQTLLELTTGVSQLLLLEKRINHDNIEALNQQIKDRASHLRELITDYLTTTQLTPNKDMIWFIQQSLTALSDRIFTVAYPVPEQDPAAANSLLGDSMGIIQELLDFVENHFPFYFNADNKMPDYLLMKARGRFLTIGEKIANEFLQRYQLPHTAGVIRDYYDGLQVGSLRITYRDIAYAEKLADSLLKSMQDEHATEMDVLETFIHLRFNKREFMRHHKSLIREITYNNHPPATRITSLMILRHSMEAMGESNTWIYKATRRSPKEEFLASLDEAIAVVRQQENEWEPNPGKLPIKYFPIKLTLRQLAHLVKLHILAGLTPHKNFSQVIALIAIFVHPQGMEKVDPENARTKGLSTDKPTIQGLADYLTKLLETLKEHYGDYLI